MGSKVRKAEKQKKSADAAFREIERLLARDRLREAVKAARVLHRKQNDAQSSGKLQDVLLRRIEQLEGRGMNDTAAPLVDELLALPHHRADLDQRLAAAMVRLGMAERALALQGAEGEGGEGTSAGREAIESQVADASVGNPEAIPASMPHLADDAATIRSALAHIEAGEDEAARELLASISRRSPYSAWRLFARGLIAFYNDDQASAEASWDRIDAGRLPARLAARLRELRQPGEAGQRAAVYLEQTMKQPPLLETLLALRSAVSNRDWSGFSAAAKQVKRLGKDEHWLTWRRSVTAAIYPGLIHAAAQAERKGIALPRWIDQLLKSLDPLEIDPTWDRYRALAFAQTGQQVEAAEHWQRYEAVIESHGLFGESRDLARSMVCARVANIIMDDAVIVGGLDHLLPSPSSMETEDAEESAERERQIELALQVGQRSIELAPSHLPHYEMVAELCQSANRPQKTAEAYELLLGQDPQHADAHRSLADHYLTAGKPEKALPHARQLHQLTPLDRQALNLLYLSHVRVARSIALEGDIEGARQHMDEAEATGCPDAAGWEHAIKRAMLERKADDHERANEWLSRAEQIAPDEGALHLVASIEAHRFRLPARVVNQHMKPWRASLRGRATALRAVAMAEVLRQYIDSDVKYPDRETHIEGVLNYIRRASSRMEYTVEQMKSICILLARSPQWFVFDDPDDSLSVATSKALERIVERGKITFRKLPEYQWIVAQHILHQGDAGYLLMHRLATVIHRVVEMTRHSEDPVHQQIYHKATLVQQILPSGMTELAASISQFTGAIYDEDEDEDDMGPWIGEIEEQEEPAPARRRKQSRQQPLPFAEPDLFETVPDDDGSGGAGR